MKKSLGHSVFTSKEGEVLVTGERMAGYEVS